MLKQTRKSSLNVTKAPKYIENFVREQNFQAYEGDECKTDRLKARCKTVS